AGREGCRPPAECGSWFVRRRGGLPAGWGGGLRLFLFLLLFVLPGLGLLLLFLDLGLQLRFFFLAVDLGFLDVVLLLLELLLIFFLLLGRGHGRLFDGIVGVRRGLGGVWRGGGRRGRLGWGAGRVGAHFLALIDLAIAARVADADLVGTQHAGIGGRRRHAGRNGGAVAFHRRSARFRRLAHVRTRTEEAPKIAQLPRLDAVLHLKLHARHGHGVGLRNRALHDFELRARIFHVDAERVVLDDALVGRHLLILEFVAHAVVALGELPQGFVGLAVDGELVHHRLEAVGGGREAALLLIQCAHAEFAIGQHLLNVAQLLLRQGSELAVGVCRDELFAFLLRAQRVHGVAIRLFHLLVVDVADLFLGFGGLFHGRIEQAEVLVFGFSLRQSVTAAFTEPSVGDGQLGLGQIFAGVVGVDEVLQQQARDFETGVLDIVDGLVKQHLVGLLGVFGDGVGVLFAAYATAAQEYRNRQDHSGRTNRVSNHNHSITLKSDSAH